MSLVVVPRVSGALLAHGIAQGGYAGAPDPTKTTVTLDTTGATWILAIYVGDGTNGGLDPFTDSAGNPWTPEPVGGFNFGTHTATIYWCGSPITSSTHTFQATCISGSGHACLAVQAWGAMASPAFVGQTATDSSTSPFTVSYGAAGPYVLTFATVGMGDPGVPDTAVQTNPSWTIIDSLGMQPRIPGICGLTVGYQLLSAPATVTSTWTFGASAGHGGVGTAISEFSYTAPPAPMTTTYQIRRLRRVALPWDEAHRWKRLDRLELVAQAGIGDSVTTDPVVMLRLSRDGGLTWGTEHHLHVGAVGDYLKRLSIRRLGRARYPVVELTTTDPVAWQWVELLVDLEEGTS